MSTVAVNEITDEVGTGSPAFTNGLAQSDIAGALNATGTAPIYACRAWVNFDGTTATIRDSGNVSSITKNGTGTYTVNFATALPDNNYSVSATSNQDLNNWGFAAAAPYDSITSNSFTIRSFKTKDQSVTDHEYIQISVFR